MCLAIPGLIVELGDDPGAAKVDVLGARRSINVDLLDEPAAIGDWVLIHVGFALTKIAEEEAREQLEALRALGEATLALEEVMDGA